MKELSIFIDESGDFGPYSHHSPWYIVTMVFHNQDINIDEPVQYLENQLEQLGYSNILSGTFNSHLMFLKNSLDILRVS